MTLEHCQSQLFFRVKRGLGSPAESRALEAHLQACETCRLLHELSSDFDAEGNALPDDAARITRLARNVSAARALTRTRFGAVSSKLGRSLGLIALGVTTSAAAASTLVWFYNTRAPEPPPATAGQRTHEQLPAPKLQALARIPAPPRPSAAEPSTTEPGAASPAESGLPAASAMTSAAHPNNGPARAASATKPAQASPHKSVDELFQLASRARRAGEGGTAMRHYREIVREYPGSREAALSHVSLGNLLLEGGAAAAALSEFDAYLKAPLGSMAAEAEYGRARALGALGRTQQELLAWQRLLADFPSSPYATRAKRRIDELAR